MRAPGWVVAGGVVGGGLDLVYAFGFHAMRGVPPVAILQSIASGLLGKAAYAGGVATAALGAFLHFFIAIVASAVFFAASRRWPVLATRWIAGGVAFGIAMYAVMNYVVLPLSAFPHARAFDPLVVGTGLLAHMVLFGLPIAWAARTAVAGGARQ